MKERWSRSVRRLLSILLLFAGLLLLLEFQLGEDATKMVGFYAGVGFLACIGLIATALLLGKIIKRKDNHYER